MRITFSLNKTNLAGHVYLYPRWDRKWIEGADPEMWRVCADASSYIWGRALFLPLLKCELLKG